MRKYSISNLYKEIMAGKMVEVTRYNKNDVLLIAQMLCSEIGIENFHEAHLCGCGHLTESRRMKRYNPQSTFSKDEDEFVFINTFEEMAEYLRKTVYNKILVIFRNGVFIKVTPFEGNSRFELCHECRTTPERFAKLQGRYLKFLAGEPVKISKAFADLLYFEGYEYVVEKEEFSCGCQKKEFGLAMDCGWHFLGKYTLEDGEVCIHKHTDRKCPVCEAREQEKRMDPQFNEIEWIHSLDAFRGSSAKVIQEHMDSLMEHPEFEVCCSDYTSMVGGVGVAMKGTLTGLFDYDCYSIVDKGSGKRYATRATFIGDDYNSAWTKKSGDYLEAWVKQHAFTKIIVADYIVNGNHPRRIKTIKELAKKYNLPVFVRKFNENGYEDVEFFDPVLDGLEFVTAEAVVSCPGCLEGWIE